MFKHNGYRWVVNYDITKLSAGDFISLSKLTESEESIIGNLPQLVAMFVKPYKLKWFKLKEVEMDYEEKVEHIKSINVGIVYPLCVFFCKVICYSVIKTKFSFVAAQLYTQALASGVADQSL
jgi:hypothetical protein